MKIKKGDILIGKDPHTGEKVKFKYLGEYEKSMIRSNGFKHLMIEKRKGQKNQLVIISNLYAKELGLKVYKHDKE